MTILGRGLTGLPTTADSLLVGITGGILDELPVGTLNQLLTVTAGGVDWADAPADSVLSVNGSTGTAILSYFLPLLL